MPRSWASFETALKPHENTIDAVDGAFMAETADARAIIKAAAPRRAVAAEPHRIAMTAITDAWDRGDEMPPEST